MNSLSILCLAVLLALPCAHARIWKDKQGRAIVADLVSATETTATVLKGDQSFDIPLASLSEDDQQYVKEWLEAQAGGGADAGDDGANQGGADKPGPNPAPKPGQMTFDGQELITGGKVNKYEYPYSEEDLETVKKKYKSDDTGYKIAIAVPHDFDPAGPMKVFIPSTAVNNAAQGLSGNFGVVGFYAKKCVENGWVCIAEDTNLGRKNHNMDLVNMFKKLNAEWPGLKNAEFAVGGFSGGGKACWWDVAYLLKNDYKVIGAMLSGVNADLSMSAREDYRAPKGLYKDIKIHLSNGKWDKLADGSKQDYMEKSLKKNGMRKIKKTFHEGKHNLEINQIPIALEFFTSDAEE